MKLPIEFVEKMQGLMGDEFASYLESYIKPRFYGLRVNTLKISVEEFLKIAPFHLEPVPWARDGFYYQEGDNPGRHPYYYAGLYYIQEPSAMLPGAVIGVKPGERVLDLCAAPGGKTVQMAAQMKGQGLLVANDINSDRVKALVKNVELAGVRNALVLNEPPDKLAARFQNYFDRIMVDAPCSGEGMFRKDEDAIKSWEKFKCEKCCGMQWNILEKVDMMLKPGGVILYSTCTFSPEEDELMIERFMDEHKGMYELLEIPKAGSVEGGRTQWSKGGYNFDKAARLWPHKLNGEGHFAALLQKKDSSENFLYQENPVYVKPGDRSQGIKVSGIKEVKEFNPLLGGFMENNTNLDLNGYLFQKGVNLYHLPVEIPDLSGLKVAKFGWYLGETGNKGFVPSHSLAVSMSKSEMKNTISFESNSRDVNSYLKGETLIVSGEKGYTGVCVDNFPLGWAKQTGDMLKNLYPKGWRKMS
ncbi:RsmF rRNA methyltransferase first C-terminal domain-containing protein [Ruminiclostridium cellulolyticum]|uniref:RNA methylase, NOL1/NOP2/sun family n=1 Tax=Ruminiclostridium cellulolyticum (strain ATCC 35319 / DSM 5812 / JCM 6584 / H10) TaxID=394503 RepID=B8I481_RUMCH|nr:RsmB/NOP family class I SAM-dependent RNA methyltransferase [Ruminiclostridium cellulolyticum]ACL76514.1 RNA methylase, NOL1/NOP2/sun family [Ruminiclostridium cellulolyticum H10]